LAEYQRPSERELYWLAGILEGEGYFAGESGYRGEKRRCMIQLGMTDLDVVERAAKLMGVEEITTLPQPEGYKTKYRISIGGDKARDLMRSLIPIMGERRTARIQEILDSFSRDVELECTECGVTFVQPWQKKLWKVCSEECKTARRRRWWREGQRRAVTVNG
jgi:hypothetical protein